MQYLKGGKSSVGKLDRAPLRKSLTGYLNAVAICGEQRLDGAVAHDVVCEYLVYYAADVFKIISARNEGLVVGGGVGDIEIVAAVAVKFRINSVERERDLSVNVGANGVFWPRREYLT